MCVCVWGGGMGEMIVTGHGRVSHPQIKWKLRAAWEGWMVAFW